jgi:prepilin-type processing-associated H-X9-DG protein
MKQIAQAALQYATDNHGNYPPRLEDLMLAEDVPAEAFVCPASEDSPASGATKEARAQNLSSGAHLSYIYVGQRLTTSSAQPNTVVLYEPLANHGNGGNFLFADGRVEFLPEATAEQVIQQLQNNINPPKY